MVDDAHGEASWGKAAAAPSIISICTAASCGNRHSFQSLWRDRRLLIAGKKVIIEHLRQKGRPFLFSSALTPADVAAWQRAVDILDPPAICTENFGCNTRISKRDAEAGFNTGRKRNAYYAGHAGRSEDGAGIQPPLFEENVFAHGHSVSTVPWKARIRFCFFDF